MMPDNDDAWTIVDWIDDVNSLSDDDPFSDDDESAGTCDEMDGWDLDGDDNDEDDEDE